VTATLNLDDPVGAVPGVGPQRERAFHEIGLLTVEDLLLRLPMRYEDRSRECRIADLSAGEPALVAATVVRSRKTPGRRGRAELLVEDGSGRLPVVWFHQPYLADALPKGAAVRLWGAPSAYRDRLQMVNPVQVRIAEEGGDGESLHLGRPVPVHRRLGSLGPAVMRRLVDAALRALDRTDEGLPAWVLREHELLPRSEALERAHYPLDGDDLRQWTERRSPAHRRLVLQEFIGFQTALALHRRRAAAEPGYGRSIPAALGARVVEVFPFELTPAQKRCVAEICSDLERGAAMHRLLQGDVGSGKTAVAAAAVLPLVALGEQAAVLAPTEILVQQHRRTLGRWGEAVGVEVVALTATTRAPERRAILRRLAAGEPLCVVGTHALLQPRVRFDRLGLVVVDEQHRFGVGSRAALRAKGKRQGAQPDLLVMTATPIPRSLALTLYGDLEVSRLDELPPGRAPIDTRTVADSERRLVAEVIRKTVGRGERVYVVSPRIAETEDALRSAVELHREVGEWLEQTGVGVELLHGELDNEAKAAAMRRFERGEAGVLVATTVIEVGVDVPEATLMVIEHADRFGLAQLHQLRGRVGRGQRSGTCLLVAPAGCSEPAEERLRALCASTDGFVLAEQDLQLRGPGEVLGHRQSGAFGLRVGDPFDHPDWLEEAREIAGRLAAAKDAESRRYCARLRDVWRRRLQLGRAG